MNSLLSQSTRWGVDDHIYPDDDDDGSDDGGDEGGGDDDDGGDHQVAESAGTRIHL